MSIKNNSGVFNARKGIYNGRQCVFTHRNPSNGYLWSDDIPVGYEWGMWVRPEEVQFID